MAYSRPLNSWDKKRPADDWNQRYPSSGWGRSNSSSDWGRSNSSSDWGRSNSSSVTGRSSSDWGISYFSDTYKKPRYSEPVAPPAPAVVSTEKVLYVGNLPRGVTEIEVKEFLNILMQSASLATAPGDSIHAFRMSSSNNFGLAEFRSVQEASKALGLDGVRFNDQSLRLKYLSDNTPRASTSAGAPVVPSLPSRSLVQRGEPVGTPAVPSLPSRSLGQLEEPVVAAVLGPSVKQRVLVHNIPPNVSQAEVRELLKVLLQVAGKPDAEIFSICLTSNIAVLQVEPNRVADFLDLDGANFKGNKLKITSTMGKGSLPPALGEPALPPRASEMVLDQRPSSVFDQRTDLFPRRPVPAEPALFPRASEMGLHQRMSSMDDQRSDLIPRRPVVNLFEPVPRIPDPSVLVPPAFPSPPVNSTSREVDFAPEARGRLLHVRNLPRGDLKELKEFLNDQMHKRGLSDRQGNVVLACTSPVIYKYAFVEFRSEEEATNGLELDKIKYRNLVLRVRRPSGYVPPVKVPEPYHYIEVSNIPQCYPGRELADVIRDHMKDVKCIKSYYYRDDWKGYLMKIVPKTNMKKLMKLNGTDFHGQPMKIRELKDFKKVGRNADGLAVPQKTDPNAPVDKNSPRWLKKRAKNQKRKAKKLEKLRGEGEDAVPPPPKNWRMASWNVEGAVGAEKQAAIDTALHNKGIMLAVLQDTRLPSGSLTTDNYTWYLGGEIAVLVRNNLKVFVEEWKSISSTLGTIKLKSDGVIWTVIAVSGIPDGLPAILSPLTTEGGRFFLIGDFKVKMTKLDGLDNSDKYLDVDQIVFEAGGEALKKIMKENNLFLTTNTDTGILPVDGHIAGNCKILMKAARSEHAYPRTDTPHMVVLASTRLMDRLRHPAEQQKDPVKQEKDQ